MEPNLTHEQVCRNAAVLYLHIDKSFEADEKGNLHVITSFGDKCWYHMRNPLSDDKTNDVVEKEIDQIGAYLKDCIQEKHDVCSAKLSDFVERYQKEIVHVNEKEGIANVIDQKARPLLHRSPYARGVEEPSDKELSRMVIIHNATMLLLHSDKTLDLNAEGQLILPSLGKRMTLLFDSQDEVKAIVKKTLQEVDRLWQENSQEVYLPQASQGSEVKGFLVHKSGETGVTYVINPKFLFKRIRYAKRFGSRGVGEISNFGVRHGADWHYLDVYHHSKRPHSSIIEGIRNQFIDITATQSFSLMQLNGYPESEYLPL